MLYAHMQTGSLNPNLMTDGAQVAAGDFLGLAGNTGNSTAPHLHIHAQKGTQPEVGPRRPIPFRDICVLDRDEVIQAGGPGPDWVNVAGMGLPSTPSAIHPEACPKPGRRWVAVDPLSLLLKGSVYVKLTLPDPPPFENFRREWRQAIRAMSREERAELRTRLRQYSKYLDAIEEELRGGSR